MWFEATWIYVPQVMQTHTRFQNKLSPIFFGGESCVLCQQLLKRCVVSLCSKRHKAVHVLVWEAMFVQTGKQLVLWKELEGDVFSLMPAFKCLLFNLDCIWWVLKQVHGGTGAAVQLGGEVLTQQAQSPVKLLCCTTLNCVWHVPVIPAHWKLRQDEQKFKVLIDYIAHWQSARDTQDLISTNKKHKLLILVQIK